MSMIKTEGEVIFATERTCCKSSLLVAIINNLGKEKVFEKILIEIKKPESSLEYVHDLMECIHNAIDVFHYSFASTFIPQLCDTVKTKLLSSTTKQLQSVQK
jgi:hypothetical protein